MIWQIALTAYLAYFLGVFIDGFDLVEKHGYAKCLGAWATLALGCFLGYMAGQS